MQWQMAKQEIQSIIVNIKDLLFLKNNKFQSIEKIKNKKNNFLKKWKQKIFNKKLIFMIKTIIN